MVDTKNTGNSTKGNTKDTKNTKSKKRSSLKVTDKTDTTEPIKLKEPIIGEQAQYKDYVPQSFEQLFEKVGASRQDMHEVVPMSLESKQFLHDTYKVPKNVIDKLGIQALSGKLYRPNKRHSSLTHTTVSSSRSRDGLSSNSANIFSGQPARDKYSIVGKEDTNFEVLQYERYEHGIIHDFLRHLSEIMIPNTPANREWLYKKSAVAQVIVRIIAMTITGSGVGITAKDPVVKEALEEFLQNLRGADNDYNVSDLIADIVRDNAVHGIHVSSILETEYTSIEDIYKIQFTEKSDPNIDTPKLSKNPVGRPRKKRNDEKPRSIQTHRLDGRTIQKVTHSTLGKIKYVQDVYSEHQIPTAEQFIKPSYNPVMRNALGQYVNPLIQRHYVINILPENVLAVNLYREPPIIPVMEHIAHTIWLTWAQKKVGLKYAAPIPIVKLSGDSEMVGEDVETRQDSMDAIADSLSEARFGDAIVLDFDQELVNWVGQSNVGFEFTKVIDSLDKRVALAFGSSLSLFEASGAELATSRTIQDTFLSSIEGNQVKLGKSLRILCYKQLSARGIPFTKESFGFDWSPIRHRMIGEITNAANTMWNSGMIKTRAEGRNLTKGLFDLPEDTDNKSYNDIIEEKAYADVYGREKAKIDLIKEQNALVLEHEKNMLELDFQHQKKLKGAGLIAQPAQNGGDGASKPKSKPKSKKNDEDTQGSTTGDIQAGKRPTGPQGTGKTSITQREEQTTGKN